MPFTLWESIGSKVGRRGETLRNLRERWSTVYPKTVKRWETKAYALMAFLRHPKTIQKYLYTTNQLEWLAKEMKRRTKAVEVFCGEEAVAKLLYFGPEPSGRGMGSMQAAGICGNPDGELSC